MNKILKLVDQDIACIFHSTESMEVPWNGRCNLYLEKGTEFLLVQTGKNPKFRIYNFPDYTELLTLDVKKLKRGGYCCDKCYRSYNPLTPVVVPIQR